MADRAERDIAAILDAIQAGDDAIAFVAGMDRGAFLLDRKTQAAVQHKLLVLGEAIKRVSDTGRQRHPQIAWHAAARTRDRLIHGYDSVDLDLVWRILAKDLPELLAQLRKLLPPDTAR
jgi:uncharacterized protein with HEPN domain